jgi:hypothetical protein
MPHSSVLCRTLRSVGPQPQGVLRRGKSLRCTPESLVAGELRRPPKFLSPKWHRYFVASGATPNGQCAHLEHRHVRGKRRSLRLRRLPWSTWRGKLAKGVNQDGHRKPAPAAVSERSGMSAWSGLLGISRSDCDEGDGSNSSPYWRVA